MPSDSSASWGVSARSLCVRERRGENDYWVITDKAFCIHLSFFQIYSSMSLLIFLCSTIAISYKVVIYNTFINFLVWNKGLLSTLFILILLTVESFDYFCALSVIVLVWNIGLKMNGRWLSLLLLRPVFIDVSTAKQRDYAHMLSHKGYAM
jgi:hypothetical protein